MRKVHSLILGFLLIACSLAAQTSTRIFPVNYASCDLKDNPLPASNLWDKKITIEDKWCCFHAGYNTLQEHWVSMDFGAVYTLDRIVIYHEGHKGNPIFNTEDFDLLISTHSIDGPWEILARVVDNTNSTTYVQGIGKQARYVKFVITDNQSMGDPLVMNGDFACRVLELEVYALLGEMQAVPSPIPTGFPEGYSPFAPQPTPSQLSPGLRPYRVETVPTPAPTPASAFVVPVTPITAAQPVLYYFYSPQVQESVDLYQNVLGSQSVLPYVTKYKVIPVNYNTDRARFQQYLVIRIPTILITDQMGSELRRHPGSFTAQEIINFLAK